MARLSFVAVLWGAGLVLLSATGHAIPTSACEPMCALDEREGTAGPFCVEECRCGFTYPNDRAKYNECVCRIDASLCKPSTAPPPPAATPTTPPPVAPPPTVEPEAEDAGSKECSIVGFRVSPDRAPGRALSVTPVVAGCYSRTAVLLDGKSTPVSRWNGSAVGVRVAAECCDKTLATGMGTIPAHVSGRSGEPPATAIVATPEPKAAADVGAFDAAVSPEADAAAPVAEAPVAPPEPEVPEEGGVAPSASGEGEDGAWIPGVPNAVAALVGLVGLGGLGLLGALVLGVGIKVATGGVGAKAGGGALLSPPQPVLPPLRPQATAPVPPPPAPEPSPPQPAPAKPQPDPGARAAARSRLEQLQREAAGAQRSASAWSFALGAAEFIGAGADRGVDLLEKVTGPQGKFWSRAYKLGKGVGEGFGEALANGGGYAREMTKGLVKGGLDVLTDEVAGEAFKKIDSARLGIPGLRDYSPGVDWSGAGVSSVATKLLGKGADDSVVDIVRERIGTAAKGSAQSGFLGAILSWTGLK